MIQNNLMVINGLWPIILPEVYEPKIYLVSQLFKKIYEIEEVICSLLSKELNKRGLLHLLVDKTPKDQLINAKKELVSRLITSFSRETKKIREKIKGYEVLPFRGFLKLFKDEADLNLIQMFKKIPLRNKSCLS